MFEGLFQPMHLLLFLIAFLLVMAAVGGGVTLLIFSIVRKKRNVSQLPYDSRTMTRK